MAVVPSPPTPVLLYLGAGYDLSPILSFAPNPLYQIDPSPPPMPTRPTYTSFLFADAKPRHTSAFMVPDFDEWLDVPARVRNVVRYAQGMLDRYRLVDDDLIWFEGGGPQCHVAARRSDPAWVFVPTPTSALRKRSHHPQHFPLTTLFYAFNVLDIELARIPALSNVWPCVTALYVHGLRPHPITGLDRLIGGFSEDKTRRNVVLGSTSGLKHVYVIVGSWGTARRGRALGAGSQQGVRDVDFVKAARRRWRKDPPHSHSVSHTDTLSPLVFRRSPPVSWGSSVETFEGDDVMTPAPSLTHASTLDTLWNPSSYAYASPHARSLPRTPFYTRIPQIAWEDTLHGGRGGYYVYKTVEECLAVWRGRGEGLLETESEDSASEEDEFTYPCPPSHLRPISPLRPRLAHSTLPPSSPSSPASCALSPPPSPRRSFWFSTNILPLSLRNRHLNFIDFLRRPAPVSAAKPSVHTCTVSDLKPTLRQPFWSFERVESPRSASKTKSSGRQNVPLEDALWIRRLMRPHWRQQQGYVKRVSLESDVTR